MSISQNTALFSILGTTYGGNGQTTFALPDLRGRVPVGTGQGPGLPNITLAEITGEPTQTLISTEMPVHVHQVRASTAGQATTANPTNNVLGIGKVPSSSETINMYSAPGATATLDPSGMTAAGGSQPHNNMQPYLGMNYIICLFGIFPSRN
jgi:microcystin-dependent protein